MNLVLVLSDPPGTTTRYIIPEEAFVPSIVVVFHTRYVYISCTRFTMYADFSRAVGSLPQWTPSAQYLFVHDHVSQLLFFKFINTSSRNNGKREEEKKRTHQTRQNTSRTTPTAVLLIVVSSVDALQLSCVLLFACFIFKPRYFFHSRVIGACPGDELM